MSSEEVIGEEEFLTKRAMYCREQCKFSLQPRTTVTTVISEGLVTEEQVTSYLILCSSCGFCDPYDFEKVEPELKDGTT